MLIMSNPTPFKAAPPQAVSEPSENLPSVVPTEDLVLVQRSQHGDTSAYDELVRRYQERVYAIVYHMTSNHEDANDLAQETFIKGYQALKSFRATPVFIPGFIGLRSTRRSTLSSRRRTKPTSA